MPRSTTGRGTRRFRSWAERFRLLVPDLRGHGESGGSFEFDAAVLDLLALLDRSDGQHVVLVGLSLGGNLAQEVVRRVPQVVSAIVAAGHTSNLDNPAAFTAALLAFLDRTLAAPDAEQTPSP